MAAKSKRTTDTVDEAKAADAESEAADAAAADDGTPPDEDDLDAMDEAPEGYAPLVPYEDTAPPGEEPGNDAVETMRANTEFEDALIERNARRYDLRTSGLSSAEVNEIEEDERAAARS